MSNSSTSKFSSARHRQQDSHARESSVSSPSSFEPNGELPMQAPALFPGAENDSATPAETAMPADAATVKPHSGRRKRRSSAETGAGPEARNEPEKQPEKQPENQAENETEKQPVNEPVSDNELTENNAGNESVQPHKVPARQLKFRVQSGINSKILRPKILVIGVGGAGNNAISNLVRDTLEGVDVLALNTDAQTLDNCLAPDRIQLGPVLTQGLGAGADPSVGRDAAEESRAEILEFIHGYNICFIAAGMGGGTGTGASPIIAEIVKNEGLLAVGIVTKPFHFEGRKKMQTALRGIEELQRSVDTLVVIPNQNLFQLSSEQTSLPDAFRMADNVLCDAVRSITDLILRSGLKNLDFNDIRSVMTNKGQALVGTGEATGENRARQAAENAMNNPLIESIELSKARNVLINITAGFDITAFEVDEINSFIREQVDPDADVHWGANVDETMHEKLRVSVIVTGFGSAEANQQSWPEAPATNAYFDNNYRDRSKHYLEQRARSRQATAAKPISVPESAKVPLSPAELAVLAGAGSGSKLVQPGSKPASSTTVQKPRALDTSEVVTSQSEQTSADRPSVAIAAPAGKPAGKPADNLVADSGSAVSKSQSSIKPSAGRKKSDSQSPAFEQAAGAETDSERLPLESMADSKTASGQQPVPTSAAASTPSNQALPADASRRISSDAVSQAATARPQAAEAEEIATAGRDADTVSVATKTRSELPPVPDFLLRDQLGGYSLEYGIAAGAEPTAVIAPPVNERSGNMGRSNASEAASKLASSDHGLALRQAELSNSEPGETAKAKKTASKGGFLALLSRKWRFSSEPENISKTTPKPKPPEQRRAAPQLLLEDESLFPETKIEGGNDLDLDLDQNEVPAFLRRQAN